MSITRFDAFDGLDADIRQSLLQQIRDLWTHNSTAIEGNTLTLGETRFVIEEGLTVSGKPLKDHQQVIGHAHAIELLYSWLERGPGTLLVKEDLFALHRAVQTEVVIDIYKPYGGWKIEPNGTYAVTAEGVQSFIDYAPPADVPALMREWIAELNRLSREPLVRSVALDAYARMHLGFVHIHPFWDGNGRMARLLCNLPLLRHGHLPLVIETTRRKEYIDTLAAYEIAAGRLDATTGVWPNAALIEPFARFCADAYRVTDALIEQALRHQARRPGRRNEGK